MRQDNGWGSNRHRLRLFRVKQRRDHLLQLGLEEPELMRRHERWLRSPFLEEEVDRSSCRLARHGYKVYADLCEHHVDSKCEHIVEDALSTECERCGCSRPFDEYGDRICWCDSCEGGCHPTGAVDVEKVSSALEAEASSRWERIVAGALNLNSTPLGGARAPRKHRQARRLQASSAEVNRWARLHGSNDAQTSVNKRRALLLREAPPQQLTLSYQHVYMEATEHNRRERRIRSRWNRMFLSLCEVHRHKTRRLILREVAASCAAVATPSSFHLERLPSVPLAMDDEFLLAAELGLDVDTYRMLRQLEQRDILPEDYDLLGRLDDTLKPRTLKPEDLARFETRTYVAPSTASSQVLDTSLADFGISYWRLPLPALTHIEEDIDTDIDLYGVGFWKLPMASLEDDSASTCASGQDASSDADHEYNVCGVCLVDFVGGEDLRILTCGHHFHRECIDHWLLNCSTACPVDKRDLADAD